MESIMTKDEKYWARLKTSLQSIDWNFDYGTYSQATNTPTFNPRKYYWWPATFIPEIPQALIQILTQRGDTVYDPFGGIGTSYFQSLLLGRNALMTEVSGVSVKIVRSILELMKSQSDMSQIRNFIFNQTKNYNENKSYVDEFEGNTQIDQLEQWFHPSTFNQILFLSSIGKGDQPLETGCLSTIGVLGILNTACSQKKGWGCIADNMVPKNKEIAKSDSIKLFNSKISILIDDLIKLKKKLEPLGSQILSKTIGEESVIHADARQKSLKNESVDLIITSPPYPNMTDYVTSHRLSYYYLGQDMKDLRNFSDFKLEIGARTKRSKKDAVEDYVKDMKHVNEVTLPYLKEGGIACYVLPSFAQDGRNNLNRSRAIGKFLYDIEENGLTKLIELERVLPKIRRSHNVKWASLDREQIIVYKKV